MAPAAFDAPGCSTPGCTPPASRWQVGRLVWWSPIGYSPASRWIGASRLHTLTPPGPLEKLYRLRGAVERENGRLKNEWALLPLRVRRLERMRLHADLTMLASLASALVKARTGP